MTTETYNVLSIDAWKYIDGWAWNNWFNAGTIELKSLDNNRYILKALRESGRLSDHSKGRVSIVDDQYNLVIVNKSTKEPLFAIVYGDKY